MANDKDIKIGIQTTADTTGFTKTDEAAKKLNGTLSVSTVDQFLANTTDKVKNAEFAFYDLDRAQTKASASTETFTAGASKLKQGTTNSAQSLLIFSQGFEDLQYGIRGVLNNIPSLIISLGGTAGLAGAISIAAVAGSQLYSSLTKTDEKAADSADKLQAVADRVKEIAENMAAADEDVFQANQDSITASAEAASAAKKNWDESKKAEAEFSTSVLTNAEKVAKAQALIAEALGLQVNSFRDLEAIAQRQEAARAEAAKQAKAAEQDRLVKAQEGVEAAQKALDDARLTAGVERNRLEDLREELQLLRQKKAALEEVVKVEIPFVSLNKDADVKQRFAEKTAAQKELANPAFQADLKGTEQRVERLEELVRKLDNENTGVVVKAESALTGAITKAEDVKQAVEKNLERIDQTYSADNLVGKAETLAKTGEQFAAEIKAAFTNVETANAQQQQAKTTLLAAAADNKITADEMREVSEALRTLMGQLQVGLGTNTSMTQELIGVVRGFQEKQADLQRQINELPK